MDARVDARVCRLSEADSVKFVQLYCERQILWDPNLPEYKNRWARDLACREMLQEMASSGLKTTDEIKKKIKNLRSTYFQEVKKIELSRQTAASDEYIYKPRMPWFPIMDSFLRNFNNDNRFVESVVTEEDIINYDEQEIKFNPSTMYISGAHLTDAMEEEEQLHTLMEGTEDVEKADKCPGAERSEDRYSTRSGFKRRGGKKPLVSSLLTAVNKLHEVTLANARRLAKSEKAREESGGDVYQKLGDYVVATLKSMDAESAADAEIGILKVLHECRIKAIRKRSAN